MAIKVTLDESKTPRVLMVVSDKEKSLTLQWAGDTAKAVFVPTISDPAWKLISNDGTTAIFNG